MSRSPIPSRMAHLGFFSSNHTASKLDSLRRIGCLFDNFYGLNMSMLSHQSSTVQSYSPSRLHRAATAFRFYALLLFVVVVLYLPTLLYSPSPLRLLHPLVQLRNVSRITGRIYCAQSARLLRSLSVHLSAVAGTFNVYLQRSSDDQGHCG